MNSNEGYGINIFILQLTCQADSLQILKYKQANTVYFTTSTSEFIFLGISKSKLPFHRPIFIKTSSLINHYRVIQQLAEDCPMLR